MKTVKYQIGSQPFYRLGEYYVEGSIVELPDDGKPENLPSKTWKKLSAKEARQADDTPHNVHEEGMRLVDNPHAGSTASRSPGSESPTARETFVDQLGANSKVMTKEDLANAQKKK